VKADCPGIYCVLPTNNGQPGYSEDGSCGLNARKCAYAGFGNCCSVHNECGFSREHCGDGCQSGFGICREEISGQKSGAKKASLDNGGGKGVSQGTTCGGQTSCKDSPAGPCCSKYGFCGSSDLYCNLALGCQEKFGTCHSSGIKEASMNGACGSETGKGATCARSKFGSCCSKYGFCGSGELFCGEGW
jgi:hypothetical protein